MMIASLLILPLAGAVAAPLLGKKSGKLRDLALRLITLVQLALAAVQFVFVLLGEEYSLLLPGMCGMDLTFRVDGFRGLYVLIAAFMWAMAAQFSKQYFNHGENHGRYACFTLITLCGVMGVFLSDDLYTTFVFFEIMSIASYPWVAHEETKGAMRAAATYLGVSIACGMVTLMGMFLTFRVTGSFAFEALRAHNGNESLALPACLMLVGYCAKAGLAPLHIWLPKAHPVAPAPASALLSGMLTKTGLFGVIAVGLNLMGENQIFGHIMLGLGLFTMLLGAVLAVFSVNLKRTLACSSLSQIGYITTGLASAVILGHHGSLPAAGAVGHMVNHSLLKLLLFLAAGAVYMNTHTLDLSALRGYGRGKKLLHILFLIGALGLMGVPGFNGYASKTMIHEGLVEIVHEYHGVFWYQAAEWVFLFAAGLTTAYMLKLYICLFWQKNPDEQLQKKFDALNGRDMSKRSALALILAAVPVVMLGVFPNQLLMPLTRISAHFLGHHEQADVHFFAWVNLKGGLITLVIGTLVYLFIVRTWMHKKQEGYLNRWPAWMDLEELFYRPVFCRFLPWLGGALGALDRLPESRLVSRIMPGLMVGAARAMDEMVDHAMLMGREIFLVNRRELRKVRNHNIFTHLASALAEGLYKAIRFLLPNRWLPHRSPTDMRYGTYVTNAISFGLLLCAAGIVAAIIYVFIRIGT